MAALTVDADTGHWRPVATATDRAFLATVEHAKVPCTRCSCVVVLMAMQTGRARCRRCSETIKKGDIRVGVPIKWRGGTHGWISSWNHLQCCRILVEGDAPLDAAADLHNLHALAASDQQRVAAELARTDTPPHLLPLDVADGAFVRRGPLPAHAQPAAITRNLLQYQREGLGWYVPQAGRGCAC